MSKFWSIGLLLVLVWSCGQAPTQSQTVDLGVTVPKMGDHQASIATKVEAAFEQLRQAAKSGDERALGAAYAETAMVLHANGFLPEAELCYLQALQRDESNDQWAYLMGYLYSELENWEQAVTWFEKSRALEPRYSATHLRLGRCYLNLGRLEDAEKEFEWILKVNPKSAAAKFGLGKIAVEKRQFNVAVQLFESALAQQPQATAIHYPLAMAYRQLGEREKVKTLLANRGNDDTAFFDPQIAALEDLSASADDAMRRGLAALQSNRMDRAASLLSRAVELAPKDATAHLNYGFLLLRQENYDGAAKHFQQALDLDPDLVEAQSNLGVVAALKGEEEKAVEAFQKALDLDGTFNGARILLGNAYMRLGRFEDALAIHQNLMAMNPQDSRAFFYYGLTLVQLNREADALAHFESSIAKFPKQAELIEALARLLACAKSDSVRDGQRALSLADSLFRTRQNIAHAQTLAMALAETGRFSEAASLQGQVLARLNQSERPRLAEEVRSRLERYRGNRPCRQPWAKDDPMLMPGPP